MKNILPLLTAFLPLLVSAQLYNDQIFVVSGGVFEFSPPFTDYVKIDRFNPLDGTIAAIDQIGTQSTQGALISGDTLFVLAGDSVVSYNIQTATRIAAIKFPGASPSPGSVAHTADGRLLIGNWYGQSDSNLYIFDAGNLQLLHAVQGITKQAKGITIWQDTAYIAQNIPGTIDQCPPFGCYSDSIGQLAIVNLTTGTKWDEVTFSAAEGGISRLFVQDGTIYTINTDANSISRFETVSRNLTTWALPGDLSRGIGIRDTCIDIELDGRAAVWSINSQSITASAQSLLSYPAAIGFDPVEQVYTETTTDFSSYGRLYQTKSIVLDSAETGVAPEALALHYRMNLPPVAKDDTVTVIYTQDTLVNVLQNDADETVRAFRVRIIDSLNVVGAAAYVDAQQNISISPAAGIESTDTLTYEVCDGLGGCDTAQLILRTTGFDGLSKTYTKTVMVYPNPFHDILRVQHADMVDQWTLLTPDGKCVARGTMYGEWINIPYITQGLYILELRGKEGRSLFTLSREN